MARNGKSGTGEDNGNWKGGRSLASNGYVLIRVGADHPLADVRGYAYEHRIIGSIKAGRILNRKEHVHHIDGDTTNNDIDNLQVMPSQAEHHKIHRKKESGLRDPGEENPIVSCICGCGEIFSRFDLSGRPRFYVSGHNPTDAPTQKYLIKLLHSGLSSRKELIAASLTTRQATIMALQKLKKKGIVVRVGIGRYELNPEVAHG